MHSGGDPEVGSTSGEWATSHPALHELAQALGASPSDELGLLSALGGYELGILEVAERRPALVEAALVEAHRTGSEVLLDELLGVLRPFDEVTAPLVSALAARDDMLALRCVAQLFELKNCLATFGTGMTARVLAAEFATPSKDADLTWARLNDLWSWPPQQLWQVLMVADARLPTPTQDLHPLWSWLFELVSGHVAPSDPVLDEVFRADPWGEGTAEVDTLVHAHVRAFVEQAAAVAAVGSDAVAWTRWLGRHLNGCGEPDCCRPSRFEAELEQWGFHTRIGRTPWT